MTTRGLAIVGGVVALLASTSISTLFFLLPVVNPDSGTTWAEAGAFGAIGLTGVLAAISILWSAFSRGRWWAWLGLVYLGLAFYPTFIGTTLHWYGPPAVFTIVVACSMAPSSKRMCPPRMPG